MLIDQGWLVGVRHLPSPNFNARPKETDIDALIIHNISLPPRQYGGGFIERFFQNQLPHHEHPYFETIKGLEVSSHLLIARDGSITQFVSFDDRAWHAGVSELAGRPNCNDFAIGIELEGCDDVAYESAQYQSLVSVTDALMRHYPQLSRERIVGHCDIAPDRKTDPGEAFDWLRYMKNLSSD